MNTRPLDGILRKICGECVDELGEISSFIEIAKDNDTVLETILALGREIEVVKPLENGTSLEYVLGSNGNSHSDEASCVCRICLSQTNLTPFEEKKDLMQLFKNMTNLNVENGIYLETNNRICNGCIDKLEEISSFISSSLDNDRKLENNINVNEDIIECDSDDTSGSGNDIRDEPFDSELADSTLQTSQNQFGDYSRSKQQPMSTHTERKRFQCICCDKSYTRPYALQFHLLEHTGEKPIECDLCGKRFTRKERLIKHSLRHTGEKPFKCHRCDESFTENSNLRLHLLTHSKVTRFKCDFCGKILPRKNFKRHLLIHSGEKPFDCDICDKSFTDKSNLQKHMVTHTDKKPFKCDFCDKSFSRSDNLGKHLFTHTGVKPFECDRCGKCYTAKTSLTKHLPKHAGEKSFKCDFCKKKFRKKMQLHIHLRIHNRQ